MIVYFNGSRFALDDPRADVNTLMSLAGASLMGHIPIIKPEGEAQSREAYPTSILHDGDTVTLVAMAPTSAKKAE